MLGKRTKLCFTLSVIVLIVAIVLATWGFPKMVMKQIQKNVRLDNSSMTFDKWRELPAPLTFKVFLFNVTNPGEVTAGDRPKLAEVGPYVYKEYRVRTILGYGSNDTIKYTLKKTFVFDSNESRQLSEDDELTVINFPYMAAIIAVQDLMPSAVGMVNGALEQLFTNLTDPFLRVTVRDLLFDGVFLNCTGDHSALGLVCGKIKADAPPTMRASDDGDGFYFSMFSHMNSTSTGPYEMVRGTVDMYQLGHIVSYQGKTSMQQWGDQYCGQLNGSDGTIFPPIDESNVPQRLYTFEPDVCRSLYVSFSGKRTIFNFTAYYYEISESVLASKSANPNNKCFCKRNWSARHDGCLVMGVLNVAPCQGAPALASLPHYYLASDELLDYFDGGVQPHQDKHNSYIYIDPVTGVTLKGLRRLQLSIELRRVSGVPQLETVSTGVFPLLWLEEGAELPAAERVLVSRAHSALRQVDAARWALLAAAALAAAAAAVLALRSSNARTLPVCARDGAHNTHPLRTVAAAGADKTFHH